MTCNPDDSVLLMTKKLLGIAPSLTDFDPDVMSAINAALFTLKQLGAGTKDGKMVSDQTTTYQDLYGNDNLDLDIEAIKQYIYCRAKLIFDPPQQSSLLQSLKDQVEELQWRIRLSAELREEETEDVVTNATEYPNDKIQGIWDEVMNEDE